MVLVLYSQLFDASTPLWITSTCAEAVGDVRLQSFDADREI
jgi:hypothetical protein